MRGGRGVYASELRVSERDAQCDMYRNKIEIDAKVVLRCICAVMIAVRWGEREGMASKSPGAVTAR